jgi:plastocyanin
VAGTSFGVPGEPREGDKTIRVAALDSLQFDPEDIGVSRGDTVTFIVKNAGQNPHEVVLGDEASQETMRRSNTATWGCATAASK